MAKADVILSSGAKVTVEGTTEEVAALVQLIEGESSRSPRRRRGRTSQTVPSSSRDRRPSTRTKNKGPVDYIRALIDEDFFKTKQGIGEVKNKLEEQAHIYPVTTLSPALFRLVKAKELRRVKENKQWQYVNP